MTQKQLLRKLSIRMLRVLNDSDFKTCYSSSSLAWKYQIQTPRLSVNRSKIKENPSRADLYSLKHKLIVTVYGIIAKCHRARNILNCFPENMSQNWLETRPTVVSHRFRDKLYLFWGTHNSPKTNNKPIDNLNSTKRRLKRRSI